MMKKYILLLASAALLLSCSEKEDTAVSHDSISVSADTLRFGPEGGSLDLKVTSSGDWRISGLCDWVSPSSTEGKDGATVTFTAEPSDSDVMQEGYFKIFTGAAVKKIVVTSSPAYVVSLLSDDTVNLVSDGGSTNVIINTNVPDLRFEYSGDGADWISFAQRADAFGKTMLKFDVKRSAVFTSRESTVTVKGEGKSVDVKFVQAQRDTVMATEPRSVYDLAARDVEFTLKSNIDFDYSFASWMTKISETEGKTDVDGIVERTIKVHLDDAVASRFHTFEFSKNGKVYGKYTIKQQNPNPVLCNIPDPKLRVKLTEMGWVIGDETGEECEILEPGLTGTSLTLAGPNYYNAFEVDKISGLGAFPKLETLNVKCSSVSAIDVSDSKTLKSVAVQQVNNLTEIKTGGSPVATLDFGNYSYDYFNIEQITLSGNNISAISMNSSSYYIYYGYDKFAKLDVTGCPALTNLKAKREYAGWGDPSCALTEIYVTAAQQAAIDAGTLSVEKSDMTKLVVK